MNRSPLNPITDADVRQFEQDGVICLRGMFDQDWITRMSSAVDRIMDAENPLARPREVTRVYVRARFAKAFPKAAGS